MSKPRQPHPHNVEGPFYVEYGCCTACSVPIIEAPGIFKFDDNDHCYVERQPETEDETTKTIRAAWAADLNCIRYCGKDSNTLRRLAELDLRDQCDTKPPDSISPVVRNHVSFTSTDTPPITSARDLVLTFLDFLESLKPKSFQITCKPIDSAQDHATFEFAWQTGQFHPIKFQGLKDTDADWHVWLPRLNDPGDRGAINIAFDWLSADPRFTSLKWYTDVDWQGSKKSQTIPW